MNVDQEPTPAQDALHQVSEGEGEEEEKVDPITKLQDAVDGLSLAMFEALRGLRDAVAPESGNLGGMNANANNTDTNGANDGNNANNRNENSEPDFEEFWQSYRAGDVATMALVHQVNGGQAPMRREDYIRIHAKIEMEKDAELVAKLAGTVLQKSADIDDQVMAVPGMHRTRAQQMQRIEELLRLNQEEIERLDQSHKLATERQSQIRQFIRDKTCLALAIDEGEG